MNLPSLLSRSPVITDGAWGSQFQSLGLPGGDCPDGWNIERPEVVEQVARAYVSAGSQFILTNTFRANHIALEAHGLPYSAEAANREGTRASRRAKDGEAFVLASLCSCDKLLSAGDSTEVESRTAVEQQATALATAGVDALLIETMADLTEALLALEVAKTKGLPVAVCMVFDSGPDSDSTMMGVAPEVAARAITGAGASVVGANCGQGVDRYLDICRRFRAATPLPIWIKPNASTPEIVDGGCVYPTTARECTRSAAALAGAGANIIGGCCSTSPGFIRALKDEALR